MLRDKYFKPGLKKACYYNTKDCSIIYKTKNLHMLTKFYCCLFKIRKLFCFTNLLLLCALASQAKPAVTNKRTWQDTIPSFVLHGIVHDENNNPIPSASVRVKSTNNAIQTDLEGKFILEVKSNDSLVISYIGYLTKTILAGSNQTATISLQPNIEGQKLNEVVVVGYGTQKKTTMVGAVATVSVKDIQKFSTPSITNAVGGKLAGVITRQTSGEPGYDAAKIFIRGQVSQSGVNSPLIIIDGVERELQSYWTTMNIQDIESFSILKDASATAVYGNRGANGVVLITTKKGSVGKPVVTLRSEAAVVKPLRIPDYIDGYDYAQLVNESLINIDEAPKYSDAELAEI